MVISKAYLILVSLPLLKITLLNMLTFGSLLSGLEIICFVLFCFVWSLGITVEILDVILSLSLQVNWNFVLTTLA